MEIKQGDLVTRKSYNHDTVFKVMNIKNGVYYLKGVEVRLYADSNFSDLKICEFYKVEKEEERDGFKKEVDDYFYLPGKILHIDGDSEYLEKCLKSKKEKKS